jgi:hypothetical protein
MRAQVVRPVAAIAAAGSAILYYLIGFGVLDIGESTTGGQEELFGFGFAMGTIFLAVTAVTLLATNRGILAAAGLLDAIPLIGYFAMSSLREPPYEVWGLTIKVLQAVTFIAIFVMVLSPRETPEAADADHPELATKAGVS